MKTSERTLLYLLKHPKKELHVRGMERELGIVAQIISRNLKQLEKEGLVRAKLIGNQKFAYFVFSQKSKSLAAYLLEKEKEEAKSDLQPIISRCEAMKAKVVILFGSSLKSLSKAHDIDVLLISDKLDAREIDKQTTKLSAELPKPVVPLLLETKDIAGEYNKPAVQDALAGIIIKGFKEYTDIMGSL